MLTLANQHLTWSAAEADGNAVSSADVWSTWEGRWCPLLDVKAMKQISTQQHLCRKRGVDSCSISDRRDEDWWKRRGELQPSRLSALIRLEKEASGSRSTDSDSDRPTITPINPINQSPDDRGPVTARTHAAAVFLESCRLQTGEQVVLLHVLVFLSSWSHITNQR